jgi:hypothetical protein
VIYAALVAVAAGLALALHQTRARLRWERREHAVTRADLHAARVAALPSRDEARGLVFAALLPDPRAPWCVVIVDPRAPWAGLARVTPGGLRPQVIATRWGDA